MKNGGEEPLNKYNGGIKMDFYLSKERESKILAAAKEQKYSDKYETYMKMLEIMNSKDLFMDISPSNSKAKEEKHLKPVNEDKAIVNWTLES